MVWRMHEGFKTSQTFVDLYEEDSSQKIGFLNCRKLIPDNQSKT